jgi:hypothetical protein
MQSEATMSIATLVRAALVGLALVVTAPSPVTFAAAVYENLDYGFVVTAPKGLGKPGCFGDLRRRVRRLRNRRSATGR